MLSKEPDPVVVQVIDVVLLVVACNWYVVWLWQMVSSPPAIILGAEFIV